MRIGLWRDGRLMAEEERTSKEILYFKYEVIQLLGQVGYTGIEVQAGYTGAPPTPDDEFLVFIARKDLALALVGTP